jgi:hypothetical protein
MVTYGASETWVHELTSALAEGEWSSFMLKGQSPNFPLDKRLGGPRAGLNTVKTKVL